VADQLFSERELNSLRRVDMSSPHPVLTYLPAPARKMRGWGQAAKTSQIARHLRIQTHALETQSSNMGCEL
jgi:hypothetical protein